MFPLARYNVGEAFLQVTPSFKNFHERVRAEVAKLSDAQVTVTPDFTGFKEKVDAELAKIKDAQVDVTPNMAGFKEKVDVETAKIKDAQVTVTPDTTGFKEKVDAETASIKDAQVGVTPNMAGFHEKVAAETAAIKDATVTVNAKVDTAKASADVGAFATKLKAQLDAAIKAIPAIKITGDSSDIDRKVAVVRAQLATLRDVVVSGKFDNAKMLADIKAAEVELQTLLRNKDITINVKTDLNTASTALRTLRKDITDNNTEGNKLSRTFGTIGGAIGSVVGVVGSVVSSLGSLIGSSSSVGSAVTSMGSSITSASGSFAGFGSSIGSALSSALPFLATAAQWTAMGIAIAGAGAIAVGGIGQIGGAVVALASGIVPLIQSLGLLPGLLAPLGVGLATLAIGFSNTGKSGIEFKNTMDQLKGAFTPVIDSIRSQMQPAIQTFIGSIKSLAPVVQSVVPQITAAVSQVTNSFSAMFKSSSFQNDLKTLLAGAATNIRVFGDAAKNAFQGFINIMAAAQPAVNRIAQDIDQAAQKFNQWTAAARQSGELTAIFQQAATVLEQLGNTITNIAGLFKDLWDSANRTGAFTATLSAINSGITQFRDYVTQAGGAWDTLMSKAGSVTQSIVGLVGSIGNAFVTLGGQMDISGVIDTITTAINNMTPAFASIGQAATPVFENLITIIGRMVQALGPAVTQAITAFGQLLQSIDWQSVTVGIATFIKGLGDIASTLATVGDSIKTFEQLINQVTTGDFAGAAQSLQHLQELWTNLGKTLIDTSSITAAQQSVQGLNASIQGVPPTHDTKFSADTSDVQLHVGTAQQLLKTVPQNWFTKFAGDVTNIAAAVVSASASVQGVPASHSTTFTGDGAGLLTAAAGGQTAIQGVVPDWLTKFAGDTSNLISAATQGQTSAQSVPVQHNTTFLGAVDQLNNSANSATTVIGGVVQRWLTSFFGDASNVQSAAGSATSSIGTVPPDHATTFTGDPSSVAAGAAQAASSIGAVVLDHVTTFTGDASGLAAGAAQASQDVARVPSTHGSSFTGDASGLSVAAATATAGVTGVPAAHATTLTADAAGLLPIVQSAVTAITGVVDTHSTTITGDNNNLTAAAQAATTAITGIPATKTTTITANNSQALQAIQQVQQQLGTLQDKTITITIQTIRVGAEGMILSPMATGGIMPMAPGGNLALSPMSGSTAQIVAPNTWRVIGDRMTGDEAFIPLDQSSRSKMLLAESASRMGFALAPAAMGPLIAALAPMLSLAQGRVLATDDSGHPIAFANQPAIPAGHPHDQPPPVPPAKLPPPFDLDVWSLLGKLLRNLVLPALSQFGRNTQTVGRTMTDTWQKQAVTIAATMGQLHQSMSRGYASAAPASPMVNYGGSQPPWTKPLPPPRGGGLPPGYHTGYASSAPGSAYLPDPPAPPPHGDHGKGGSVFNIYPQPHQDEATIALMVDRRQAFALRS